jgi:hypothetical protein
MARSRSAYSAYSAVILSGFGEETAEYAEYAERLGMPFATEALHDASFRNTRTVLPEAGGCAQFRNRQGRF